MRILRLVLLSGMICLTTRLAAAQEKERGQAAFQRQDYYEAIPLLQTASKNAPEDEEILHLLALAYLAVNNESLAIPLLTSLAENKSETGVKSALSLAGHLSGRNRSSEALPVLRTAWARFPGRPEIFTALTAVLESLQRREELSALLASPEAPQTTETFTRRISVLLTRGRTNEAKGFAESFTENRTRTELLAWFFRRTGRTAEAVAAYRSLYETTRNLRFASECGRTLLEAGDNEAAGEIVLAMVQPAANAIRILRDLGLYDTLIAYYQDQEKTAGDQSRELILLFEAVSRWEDLLERLFLHLERSGDLDFVRSRVTDLVFLRDRKKKTLDRLEAALAATGRKDYAGQLLILLTEIRLREGNRTLALAAAERALTRAGLTDFALLCAEDFNGRGWKTETEAILQMVLAQAVKPEERSAALLRLAALRRAEKKHTEALAFLDLLDRESSNRTTAEEARSLRSLLLMELGRFDAALAVLKTMDQKRADVLLRTALCTHMNGDTPKALILVRQAGRDRSRATEALVLEGILLLASGDRKKSVEILRRAAADALPSPAVLNGLVELYVLSSLLSSADEKSTTVYARGVAALAAGRSEEAAAVFTGFAGQGGKGESFFLYRTGVSLASSGGRNQEALRLLETARQDKTLPLFVRSHAAEVRADIVLSEGRTDEAFRLYRDILLEDPRYARQNVIRNQVNRLRPAGGSP